MRLEGVLIGIVLSCGVSLSATAQGEDRCKDALLPTIERGVMSHSLELAWLHLVDETNYEKAKKSFATSGSALYGPIFAEGDASYAEFEQNRKAYFEKRQLNLRREDVVAVFRQTLTSHQLTEWGECIREQGGVDLQFKEGSAQGVNVQMFYHGDPGSRREISVAVGEGGVIVLKGRWFRWWKKEVTESSWEVPDGGSASFYNRRSEPHARILLNANVAGGVYSNTAAFLPDADPWKAPPPPPEVPQPTWVRVSQVEAPGGAWGTWGATVYCNQGDYATGFRTKIEASVGNEDDTAMNAVRLTCTGAGGEQEIVSKEAQWGAWSPIVRCPAGHALASYALKVEPPQGNGDDTAANGIKFGCRSLDSDEAMSALGLKNTEERWGNYLEAAHCPSRSAICGMQTRVEDPIHGDDSAFNGVRFECCSF